MAGRDAPRRGRGRARLPWRDRPQQRRPSRRVRAGRWPVPRRRPGSRGHHLRRALECLGHRSLVGVPRADRSGGGARDGRSGRGGRRRQRQPSQAVRACLGVRHGRAGPCDRGLERPMARAEHRVARILGCPPPCRSASGGGRWQRHALLRGTDPDARHAPMPGCPTTWVDTGSSSGTGRHRG